MRLASNFDPVTLIERDVAWIGRLEISGQMTRVDNPEASLGAVL